MYFVTCICTLTARNDIFQRVFVVAQSTFLPVLAHVHPAPPHLKPVHFLKNRTRSARPCATRTCSASTYSSLKNPQPPVRRHMAPRDLRGKTRWPHPSVVETGQFLSKNCPDISVLFKELFRQFSSFQRTVQTVQFLSKNCGHSSKNRNWSATVPGLAMNIWHCTSMNCLRL